MKNNLQSVCENQFIAIMQQIGRNNHTFKFKSYTPIVEQQYQVINSCPYAIIDRIELFKGLVLCERDFNWHGGSVASNINIFRKIKSHPIMKKNQNKLDELIDWTIKNRGRNPYTPFGSSIYSKCNCVEDVVALDQARQKRYKEHAEKVLLDKMKKVKKNEIIKKLNMLRKASGIVRKKIHKLNIELFMLNDPKEKFELLLYKEFNFPVNLIPVNYWQQILKKHLTIQEIKTLLSIIPKRSSFYLKNHVRAKLLEMKKITLVN